MNSHISRTIGNLIDISSRSRVPYLYQDSSGNRELLLCDLASLFQLKQGAMLFVNLLIYVYLSKAQKCVSKDRNSMHNCLSGSSSLSSFYLIDAVAGINTWLLAIGVLSMDNFCYKLLMLFKQGDFF